MPSAPRVVLAKPGLDGHDRGIKVIAMALRDAGAEVIYLGLRCTAERIAAAAEQEDADVVGVSILSGAHLGLTRQLVSDLRRREVHAPLVVGGTIPPPDVEVLRALGVADVLPVGTPLDEVVRRVLGLTAMAVQQ